MMLHRLETCLRKNVRKGTFWSTRKEILILTLYANTEKFFCVLSLLFCRSLPILNSLINGTFKMIFLCVMSR